MKAYNSREIIAILEQDGWYLSSVRGSHHYFKHPIKPGKITVKHPAKSYPPKTLANILKSAGLQG